MPDYSLSRRTLAGVLSVLLLASPAWGQDRDRPDADRCECVRVEPFGGREFSFMFPGQRSRAELGVSLESGTATDSVGARVGEVVAGSPAEAAGLREGDLITAIDGRSVARREPTDPSPVDQLVRRMRGIEPGDTVRVDYRRDGETLTANVVTREAPAPERAIAQRPFGFEAADELRTGPLVEVFGAARASGLELTAMNEGLAEYFGVGHGVLVLRVPNDSRLGLEPGDVLLRIGDRDVRDPRHVRTILGSYRDDEPFQIEVMRQGERRTITGYAR